MAGQTWSPPSVLSIKAWRTANAWLPIKPIEVKRQDTPVGVGNDARPTSWTSSHCTGRKRINLGDLWMTEKHTTQQATVEAFSFGDPVPVLRTMAVLLFWWSEYLWTLVHYPVWLWCPCQNHEALSPHHSSPIYAKRNILASTFIPHPLLSHREFYRLWLDYLTFGNAYIERVNALSQKPLKLNVPLAKLCGLVQMGRPITSSTIQSLKPYEYKGKDICHLIEPDINQEIYGCPEYLSALNSVWLDESATLFDRKYYINGSHAGYIMYVNDAGANKRRHRQYA